MYFPLSLFRTYSLRVTPHYRQLSCLAYRHCHTELHSRELPHRRMSSNTDAAGGHGSRRLNRLAKAKSPYLLQHAENPVRYCSQTANVP